MTIDERIDAKLQRGLVETSRKPRRGEAAIRAAFAAGREAKAQLEYERKRNEFQVKAARLRLRKMLTKASQAEMARTWSEKLRDKLRSRIIRARVWLARRIGGEHLE